MTCMLIPWSVPSSPSKTHSLYFSSFPSCFFSSFAHIKSAPNNPPTQTYTGRRITQPRVLSRDMSRGPHWPLAPVSGIERGPTLCLSIKTAGAISSIVGRVCWLTGHFSPIVFLLNINYILQSSMLATMKRVALAVLLLLSDNLMSFRAQRQKKGFFTSSKVWIVKHFFLLIYYNY